jgi:hypothetical protein
LMKEFEHDQRFSVFVNEVVASIDHAALRFTPLSA